MGSGSRARFSTKDIHKAIYSDKVSSFGMKLTHHRSYFVLVFLCPFSWNLVCQLSMYCIALVTYRLRFHKFVTIYYISHNCKYPISIDVTRQKTLVANMSQIDLSVNKPEIENKNLWPALLLLRFILIQLKSNFPWLDYLPETYGQICVLSFPLCGFMCYIRFHSCSLIQNCLSRMELSLLHLCICFQLIYLYLKEK